MSNQSVKDPSIKVLIVGQTSQWGTWNISQNLTDRWGEINDYGSDKKPLAPLLADEPLLERLRSNMYGEITFVVRKDGVYGLLFEIEFLTRESESEYAYDGTSETFRPRSEMEAILTQGLQLLIAEYPEVQFAVPDPAEIYDERSAIWAYVPEPSFSNMNMQQLGEKLMQI